MKELEEFYCLHPEPTKGCLLALRTIILGCHDLMRETWKYQTAFFTLDDEVCCYLLMDKKKKWPYVGIIRGNEIDHEQLIHAGRKKIKVFMVDPEKDIPIDSLNSLLNSVLICHGVQ